MPPPRPLRIVFEDRDIVVVHKGPGLLTSTVPGEKRPTLLAMVRDRFAADRQTHVGIVHRLDRDAAGLLVFSRNQKAFDSLKGQFFHHSVTRQYLAMVYGKPDPPQGSIVSRLVEYADGTVHSTLRPDKGQRARTDYVTLDSDRGRTRLLLTLHTGRKHQIRVQLADRGHAIVGDRVYGPNPPIVIVGDRVYGPNPPIVGPLRLVAIKLELDHPRTGERMTFEIDPPGYVVK